LCLVAHVTGRIFVVALVIGTSTHIPIHSRVWILASAAARHLERHAPCPPWWRPRRWEERTLPSNAPRRGLQPLSTWSRQDRGRNHHCLIKPRGAGPIQAPFEEVLEYHRGAKIPLLMGFGEFRRVLLRDSQDC
jgi:hypothetical protein